MWKKKLREYKGKFEKYSIRKKLNLEKKINSNFEVILNSLTLEEIIALKLETAIRLTKHKFYNFPVWKAIPSICRDAVLRYTLSACQSKRDGARMLGIDVREFDKLLKRYNTEKLFNND